MTKLKPNCNLVGVFEQTIAALKMVLVINLSDQGIILKIKNVLVV